MTGKSQTVIADGRRLWIYYWPLNETDPDFSAKKLKASCWCGWCGHFSLRHLQKSAFSCAETSEKWALRFLPENDRSRFLRPQSQVKTT